MIANLNVLTSIYYQLLSWPLTRCHVFQMTESDHSVFHNKSYITKKKLILNFSTIGKALTHFHFLIYNAFRYWLYKTKPSLPLLPSLSYFSKVHFANNHAITYRLAKMRSITVRFVGNIQGITMRKHRPFSPSHNSSHSPRLETLTPLLESQTTLLKCQENIFIAFNHDSVTTWLTVDLLATSQREKLLYN